MKTTVFCVAAIALTASMPMFAHAAPADAVQRCMDAFAAQHLPGRTTSFKIERDYSSLLPLLTYTGTQQVRVIATERASGRVVATATCAVKAKSAGEARIATRIAQR